MNLALRVMDRTGEHFVMRPCGGAVATAVSSRRETDGTLQPSSRPGPARRAGSGHREGRRVRAQVFCRSFASPKAERLAFGAVFEGVPRQVFSGIPMAAAHHPLPEVGSYHLAALCNGILRVDLDQHVTPRQPLRHNSDGHKRSTGNWWELPLVFRSLG